MINTKSKKKNTFMILCKYTNSSSDEINKKNVYIYIFYLNLPLNLFFNYFIYMCLEKI